MIEQRNILIYLSYITNGNWDQMLKIINTKKLDIDENLINNEISKMKCKTLTMLDKEYPSYLKALYKPPLVLYYYGDISLLDNLNNNLAVVGSRANSTYGEKITREIVNDISNKYTIVSGMALGIDSIAHTACLDNKGKTIAVLGSGIDYPAPKTNTDIYYRIIKNGGLVISEYPGDLEPLPEFYPIRNRLIAGFSKAVLVTEAKLFSGTSITVNVALALGREVMCLPYLAGENSLCNLLIRDGATLVENSRDVLDTLENIKM